MQSTQVRDDPSAVISDVRALPPRLSWHDVVATTVGVFTGFVFWATYQSWGWPLLGSTRAGIAALTALGLVMCITGSRITDPSVRGPFIRIASFLGVSALLISAAGLVSGAEVFLVALGADIAILWVIATTRHILRKL